MDGLFVFYLIERNADRLVAANLLKEMCEELEKKQAPKKKQAPVKKQAPQNDSYPEESDPENPAEDYTVDENEDEEQEEQEREKQEHENGQNREPRADTLRHGRSAPSKPYLWRAHYSAGHSELEYVDAKI